MVHVLDSDMSRGCLIIFHGLQNCYLSLLRMLARLTLVLGVLLLMPVVICGGRIATKSSTNLKNFVKLTSSLNPDHVTISYINGTLYSVVPGIPSQKLFYFEGYNIARKLPTVQGDFQSLSCELVVYRDPRTGIILHTWENPFTNEANEVFVVNNYPVNTLLSAKTLPPLVKLMDDVVVFNVDVPLRYPNPLPPKEYPRFSASPYYIAAELFEYFGKAKELADDSKDSINMTATWNRISQWMPWMELGPAKGNLFYSAFSWKMPNFKNFPDDILKLLEEKYPSFFTPPTDFNIPNETTWSVFKNIIDTRKKAGLPEIFLHPDIVGPNVTAKRTHLDPRLETLLLKQSEFEATWGGGVYSFTEDQPPMNLFQVRGNFSGVLSTSGDNFIVQIRVSGNYFDSKSGALLQSWTNPYTNQTVKVPGIQLYKEITIPRENVDSFLIPPSREIGLSVVTSGNDAHDWVTNGCMLVFSQDLLSFAGRRSGVSYYGTYSSISNWLPWMDMKSNSGYISFRMNIRSSHKTERLLVYSVP